MTKTAQDCTLTFPLPSDVDDDGLDLTLSGGLLSETLATAAEVVAGRSYNQAGQTPCRGGSSCQRVYRSLTFMLRGRRITLFKSLSTRIPAEWRAAATAAVMRTDPTATELDYYLAELLEFIAANNNPVSEAKRTPATSAPIAPAALATQAALEKATTQTASRCSSIRSTATAAAAVASTTHPPPLLRVPAPIPILGWPREMVRVRNITARPLKGYLHPVLLSRIG